MPGEADIVQRQHAELTDAVARGRLALAEIAAIPPRELDALYELGAECLDTGRENEAVELLAGLVALFPYTGRYWRAYAIALHRCMELDRARAAYEAALLLDPGHELTRCYRAEILFYMGDKTSARAELEALRSAKQSSIAERAADLLALLDALADWQPKPRPPPADLDDDDDATFMLDEDRSLPLQDGRFAADEDEPAELTSPEITNTAQIFAPVADPTSPGSMMPDHSAVTDTDLIRVRPPANPLAHLESTDTAIIRRQAGAGDESTDTGLVPGRGKQRAVAQKHEGTDTSMLPGRKRPAAPETTDTGLVPGHATAAPAETTDTDLVSDPTGDAASETTDIVTEPASTAPATTTEVELMPASVESTEPFVEPETYEDEGLDGSEEVTHTAIFLRRAGLPMVSGSGGPGIAPLSEEPTATMADEAAEATDVGIEPPTQIGPPVRIGSTVIAEEPTDEDLEATEIRSPAPRDEDDDG